MFRSHPKTGFAGQKASEKPVDKAREAGISEDGRPAYRQAGAVQRSIQALQPIEARKQF